MQLTDPPVNILHAPWLVDLATTTCRNLENGMVVKITMTEKTYDSKIQDMPINLFRRLNPIYIQHQVQEAEIAFLATLRDSELQKERLKHNL
jgi:hypothetical protein